MRFIRVLLSKYFFYSSPISLLTLQPNDERNIACEVKDKFICEAKETIICEAKYILSNIQQKSFIYNYQLFVLLWIINQKK